MIIKEVYREVKDNGKKEPIIEFLKENRYLVIDYKPDVQIIIADIINNYKPMTGVLSRKNEADLFLIGCAKYFKGIIVTEERLKKNSLNIPSVAQKEKIEVINLIEFFQREISK